MESISKEHERQIEEIMENFKWSKVHDAMRDLEWVWASSKTENGIPSLYELMKQARKLLETVSKYKEPGYFTGTGGFYAYNYYGNLKLSFELDSWMCEEGASDAK